MANSQIPQGSKGTVSVPVAQEEVQNWYDYLALDTTDLDVKSFLFDINSVKYLIEGTPEATGMRVYPALTVAGDPTSITLLLIPTINGKDIVKVPAPGTVGGDEDDTNIYNFATKCPPQCNTGPNDCFMTL